jgi:hypothetical protein
MSRPVSISPVRPRFKLAHPHAPEYAAAQETLAHAIYRESETQKLVIAVLMEEKADPKRVLRIYYWHSFVKARRASGHRPFEPKWSIRVPTLYEFQRPAQTGWVPVAIAYGDDGSDCQFVPIVAGCAITGAKLEAVYNVTMRRFCALFEGQGEATD